MLYLTRLFLKNDKLPKIARQLIISIYPSLVLPATASPLMLFCE